MKKTLTAILCAALAAFSCASPASAATIYGVASQGGGQSLISWDSATPGVLIASKPISGLGANASVLGIDFRPATGELYALLSEGLSYRLATIQASSGIGTGLAGNGLAAVNGFSHGFDFNPTIDRIRITSDTDTNLVYNPVPGQLQTVATNLAYGGADPNFGKDPNIMGSAYNNNQNGAVTSQLYGIDTGLDILVTQGNNTGTLGTVGPLGVDVSALGGFDIQAGSPFSAFATMTPVGSSQSIFYTINLATGAATAVGPIGGGIQITAMTAALPEPATAGMAAFAVAGIGLLRRRRA
jgi:hypothetical protein